MKQKLVKIIAILLLVSVILNFCFILKKHDHDCTHTDDCPICVLIHQAKNNLESLGLGLSAIIVFCCLIYFLKNLLKPKSVIRKNALTLFSLKVRLNN